MLFGQPITTLYFLVRLLKKLKNDCKTSIGTIGTNKEPEASNSMGSLWSAGPYGQYVLLLSFSLLLQWFAAGLLVTQWFAAGLLVTQWFAAGWFLPQNRLLPFEVKLNLIVMF